MSSDPTCRPFAGDDAVRALRVGKGRVADVFVYLAHVERPKGPPPPAVRITAERCHLSPRVVGVQVGQKLVVDNADGTLYSLRVRGGGGEVVRRLPKKGSRLTHRFTAPQTMARVSCDVHRWVVSHVGVLDHPYFGVTDEQGRFRIPTAGLADGTYEIHAWHEVLGEQVGEVKVEKGEATYDLRLGPAEDG